MTGDSAPAELIRNPERLARLRATGLLDAPTDEAFDRLTRLATKLLQAPISTVTLVDADRQFYMSCVGIPEPLASVRETPLELSFCRHTVVLGRPLVVPDTRGHPIVGENPAIAGFGVLAYAGIPLLTADGYALGTLCVMDFRVREWTEDEVASLTDLAAAVSTEIELRMDIAARVEAERELQRAVQLRDEVLAVVSHDLRNPVHTIALGSEFLLDALIPDEPGPVRTQVGIIRRAADRMDRMIRDLLDAASIAAGRLSMEVRRQDAGELMRTAGESFLPLATEKGVRFRVPASPVELALRADPDRVLQVLANLMDNAAKFTPERGEIELGVEREGDAARFWVRNSGPPIPPEQLAHLFEPFWQARRAGREGVGLGLGIARGIVEAHGGRIWVESDAERGTTFHFTIPLAPPA